MTEPESDMDMLALEVGDVVEATKDFAMYDGPAVRTKTRFLVVGRRQFEMLRHPCVHIGMRHEAAPDGLTYVFGREEGDRFRLVTPCSCGEKLFAKMRVKGRILEALVEHGIIDREVCRACLEREFKQSPLAWDLYRAWSSLHEWGVYRSRRFRGVRARGEY